MFNIVKKTKKKTKCGGAKNFNWTQLWKTLHSDSFNFTPELKDFFIQEIFDLPQKMPNCPKCKIWSVNYNKEKPFTGSTKYDYVKYIFDMHNEVNKKLNKPLMNWDNFLLLYNKSENIFQN